MSAAADLLDRLAYAGFRAAETLLLALPPRAALGLATPFGLLWWLVDGRRRKRTHANLKAAFPGMSAGERARIARQAFVSMLRVPLESIWMQRMVGTRRSFDERVPVSGDRLALTRRLDSGEPAVLLGAHLGNWELCAQALHVYPAPIKVVTKRTVGGRVFTHLQKTRGGARAVMDRRGALSQSMTALRQGTWVGFVADQNAGRGGEFVPFFDIPASTHAAPVWLALRAGVPLFVGVCLRRPGTYRFDLHVHELSLPGDTGVDPSVVREVLTRAVQQLEAWIRLDPGQYNWLHRRWKDRPRGVEDHPRVPAYDHHRPPPQEATPDSAAPTSPAGG